MAPLDKIICLLNSVLTVEHFDFGLLLTIMHLKLSDFDLRNLLLISTLNRASIKAKPSLNTDPGLLVESAS